MAIHEPATANRPSVDATASRRGGPTRSTRRRIARLERELDRLSGQEARRAGRLTRTRERARAVERRLRELRSVGASQTQAYRLRDRRIVPILDPRPVVLSNGRSAIAGTCQVCGDGIVTMVARRAAS